MSGISVAVHQPTSDTPNGENSRGKVQNVPGDSAALYFAVEDLVSVDSAVHVLHPYRLNAVHGHGAGILLPHHVASKKLIAPAFKTGEQIVGVAGILPPETDYRLLLQHGVFTVHGDKAALESHPKQNEFLAKLTVPGACRSSIKTQLRALGIDRARLFPHLQNLATYLNEGSGGA